MEVLYNITHYVLPLLRGVLALVLVLALSTCSEDPTSPESSEGNGEGNPGVDITLHEDEGHVGLVINTRLILKKGYIPETAAISFPSHSRFDTLIAIDPSTNLAILSIHRTELTEGEKTAFANGVAVNIVITNPTQQQLASYSSNQKEMDDSNIPIDLETTLPYIPPALSLKESLAYLLQPENVPGVITSTIATEYSAGFFAEDTVKQQFYFIRAQGSTPNTYLIKHPGYGVDEYFYYEPGQDYINLREGGPEEFVLEPDEDGWLKIRHKNTGKFLFLDMATDTTDRLRLSTTVMRFRIISDLNYEIEDRGTFYNQPIMGKAKAVFAYTETLLNCSSGTLETNVGNSESRTTTLIYGTTESLQLFSSAELSAGLTVSAQVKAMIGGEVVDPVTKSKVVGSLETTYGFELRVDASYTTSNTSTTENNWSREQQTLTEVSRSRTLTVLPYTSVEVFDVIKSIDNVTVPFTQVLRIRAKDRRNNFAPLSGQEIVTQLFSNLTTSAIRQIGDNFVDITQRGNVKLNRILHATTTVLEDTTVCN
jgi:hypothetical protein